MTTYKIVRHFFSSSLSNRVVKRGMSLEEAKAWCSDPETSSKTCLSSQKRAYTKRMGAWFDGYSEE